MKKVSLFVIFLLFLSLIPLSFTDSVQADNTFYQEGTISNHATGYEMFINVTYDSDMQNDFLSHRAEGECEAEGVMFQCESSP